MLLNVADPHASRTGVLQTIDERLQLIRRQDFEVAARSAHEVIC